ncbi:hypothetical protein HN018_27785 (plasmid) [Lichenicola cladoniae]|uniref:Uncharacterized protein n=1 Tax=Lichenicola cladoniae TaxID=1484109 RepID=A0A6M8I1V8_9PROT|nr:hypothetical protein [Lichenicola cladoniae]NPD69561.1 hypothetical protein [Acetobacteraceae bacterium]QKE93921.1 hypothetical protein HN018_27785 [Lichenicola cladoniae]
MIALLLPQRALAHVKWFTLTDVHTAPVPFAIVMSPTFLSVFGLFLLLLLLGFLLDGWIALRWPAWLSSGLSSAPTEQRLVRAAAGAYFICASAAGRMILTPELTTHASWIATTQFLIAFFLVWRRTCILSGFGVLVLYLDAMRRYGVFHLIDYLFLLCLAIYLASLSLQSIRLVLFREPLLTGGLAFSLAWTAIEKFLYPQWTIAVIATHPSIAMGLPATLVTVIAGFVEFTLAFYLVTGRGLLRLGGAAYAVIFIAAMPAFGGLDVFGHLVILATLAIVVLRGMTPMQQRLHLPGQGILVDTGWIGLLYLITLSLFFAAYYAMQRT